MNTTLEEHEQMRDAVREGYAQIAHGSCGASSCCGSGSAEQIAQAVGYNAAELATLPEGANMGLSCGNPTIIASLALGETVLDLGSGGGFDAFIAGKRVGASGHVIGVDMTPEMIRKARANTGTYRNNTGLNNVEFRLGEIEHLPVADKSVDVVISNCVLNLSPDKRQVWSEITRVLRPGGRVAISDIALLKPLPKQIKGMVTALIGCIAGALLVEETREIIEASGLTEIGLTPKPSYIKTLVDLNDPLYIEMAKHLPQGESISNFVTSLDISARKMPAKGCCS